jgi:lysophospholipase L1-like esterase
MVSSDATVDYAAEAADPHTLDVDAAAGLLSGAPWRRLAVLGDSLAKGIGDLTPGYRDVSWADRLVDALRIVQPDLEYLNTGVRGARTDEVVEDQLDRVVAYRPDLAVVVCGGNDLLAPGFSAAVVRDWMEQIFAPLDAGGADIVTYTLQDITTAYPELASGTLRDGIAGLNDVIREVAASHGAIVVEMWGHPTQADKGIYSADLIHASRRGHAIVAAATVRALAESLG